jgi:hypothetical protein
MEADLRKTERRLDFLKWHPVGALHFRHGFELVSESESRFSAARLSDAA